MTKPVHQRIGLREESALVVLIIGLLFGVYLFQFFSGLYPLNPLFGLPVHADPTIIEGLSLLSIADVAARISQPPIIIVPAGILPLNVTYSIFTNGNRTAYTWWYQWPNSTVHTANIWEPAYLYYDLTNPLSPTLAAIGLRFHFGFRPIFGGWTLNGTRPFISFSPTFFIPTLGTGPIARLLKPSNGTTVFNYPYVFDPNAPYPTGPNAYQHASCPPLAPCGVNGGGPIDPWTLIGGAETVQNGIVFGTIGFIFIGGIPALIIETRGRRIRLRRELLPFLIED